MPKKPVKDVFGLWQIEGENEFSGKYEIPLINGTNLIPEDLVLFSKSENALQTEKKSIHFYELDENFINALDSQSQLDSLINGTFSKYQSIILPDFSVYRDFPLALQIFQVYKSRSIGAYIEKQGLNVIPNVRWADERSYEFAFDGIKKHTLISIGVLGGYRDKNSIYFFEKGFLEMLKILEPSNIITYGFLPDHLRFACQQRNVNLFPFPTEISKRTKKAKNNQPELKLFD